MIRWNSINFNFPSRRTIINIFFLHDFIILTLFCVFWVVIFNIIYLYFFSFYNLRFLENHFLEFIWTLSPFFILCFIIFSSLHTLYFSDSCFFCGWDLAVIGHQWYWRYNLKNFSEIFFDSYMIPNFIRVRDVDNRVVVPYKTPVRVLATSVDVIHSWTIPSLGLKADCIPGRINQICFTFLRSGIFFGQCSEICGTNHRFIPIVVESVSFRSMKNV